MEKSNTKKGFNPTRHQGVSLVEVLVALFVLSIGVLGIVGLQVLSLQNNSQALNRTQAVLIANGIIDRIRANPRAATPYAINLGDPPVLNGNCITDNCDPDQIKDFDIAIWKCTLGRFSADPVCAGLGIAGGAATGLLPQGDGSIQCALAAGINTCNVTVQWQERELGDNTPDNANGTNNESVTISFQP